MVIFTASQRCIHLITLRLGKEAYYIVRNSIASKPSPVAVQCDRPWYTDIVGHSHSYVITTPPLYPLKQQSALEIVLGKSSHLRVHIYTYVTGYMKIWRSHTCSWSYVYALEFAHLPQRIVYTGILTGVTPRVAVWVCKIVPLGRTYVYSKQMDLPENRSVLSAVHSLRQ